MRLAVDLNLTQELRLKGRRRREAKRFAKFATVGALGAVTDFTVLNLLVQVVGLLPIVANAFSFTAAVLQNFTLNRRWTFPESRSRDARRQLVQFATVSVMGLGLNTLVFGFVDHLLQPYWIGLTGSPELGFLLSYNFAKLFAIGVVLFWNFSANRLWTYRGL